MRMSPILLNYNKKRSKSSGKYKSKQSPKNKIKSDKRQTQMWESILDQINSVSNRVRELSKSRKNKKLSQTDYSQDLQIQRDSQKKQKSCNEKQRNRKQIQLKSLKLNPQIQPDNIHCRQLLKKLVRLRQENQQLRNQNLTLGKKLYFQERQKKQLKWQLDREKSIKLKDQKSVLEFVYDNPKNQISRIQTPFQPTMTFRGNVKDKQNCEKPLLKISRMTPYLRKETQSLLIESNQINMNQRNREDDCIQKKVGLQKSLEELLQMSYLQKNKQEKTKIRKYMEKIAKQIKSIN